MKIIIPMAGEGSRFRAAGYSLPKPLIDVEGKPMIQRVVENLSFDADYIFLVRQSHLDDYPIADNLRSIVGSSCSIVPVPGLTEGAACTVLLADEFLDEDSLLIANSDQLVDYNRNEFLALIKTGLADYIWTFTDDNPKWSFVKTLKGSNNIIKVAEKEVISNTATCGIYYWSQGIDFSRAAKDMISRNDRVKNEFYICPSFNYQRRYGKTVCSFPVEQMWGLGTPEDLNAYLNRA